MGRDAVGCFGGGGLTNEKAYQLGKFARVALRTSAIDYNGRFCMSSAASGHRTARSASTVGCHSRWPISPQADVILLVGSNPAETMPPAMQYFDEGRGPRRQAHRRGPAAHRDRRSRATFTCSRSPGTDLALANGMLNVVAREGLIDDDYVAERTNGFEAVRRAVRLYWPDRVERITGVPENDIVRRGADPGQGRSRDDPDRPRRRAAQLRHRHGAGVHQSRPGAGPAGHAPTAVSRRITGQGNGQGGREHGQKCRPATRVSHDSTTRSLAPTWHRYGASTPPTCRRPGQSAYEMLDAPSALRGGVRALWVMASNIVGFGAERRCTWPRS